MKHFLCFIFFLVVGFYGECQITQKPVTDYKVYEIHSSILKEGRQFFVYNPGGIVDSSSYKIKYTVLYVLDAEEYFSYTMSIAKFLSENDENASKVMVVGIVNRDRERDFTPTLDTTHPYVRIPNSGGANLFSEFLKSELFPFVENKLPGTNNRIFVGISLGGLFGLTALARCPELFNAYILIDPSCWWHKQKIPRQLLSQLTEKQYTGKSMYISIANTLSNGQDTVSVKKEGQDTSSMSALMNFVENLRSEKELKIRWTSKYYEHETHWSIFFLSVFEGLRFVYKEWNVKK